MPQSNRVTFLNGHKCLSNAASALGESGLPLALPCGVLSFLLHDCLVFCFIWVFVCLFVYSFI